MASGPNIHANLLEAERLIARAADGGARLVVLPENFALMALSDRDAVRAQEPEGSGPLQDFLSEQALRHGLWLVGGSVPLASGHPDRIRSACLVMDPDGRQVGRYDKLHLFDARVADAQGSYVESRTVEPGDHVTVVDTPFGGLGLGICYDLRFPEMFRAMLDAGMEILALPSAFTAVTGRAHWEILLRARATENLCYVVAAAQGGFHANGRETYGDSMIVDPWGVVLDRLPRGSGVVSAEIERERLMVTRQSFPAVRHRRLRCSLNGRGTAGSG
jgi:nitrilase